MPTSQILRIRCPNLACQLVLAVPSDSRGKMVRCRRCGTTILVPQPATPEQDKQPPNDEAG
ncbi:MAG: hypothetical protein ACYTGR_05655 [Planctomycetota bacterium]|jgi:ribosomal protein S27E